VVRWVLRKRYREQLTDVCRGNGFKLNGKTFEWRLILDFRKILIIHLYSSSSILICKTLKLTVFFLWICRCIDGLPKGRKTQSAEFSGGAESQKGSVESLKFDCLSDIAVRQKYLTAFVSRHSIFREKCRKIGELLWKSCRRSLHGGLGEQLYLGTLKFFCIFCFLNLFSLYRQHMCQVCRQ